VIIDHPITVIVHVIADLRFHQIVPMGYVFGNCGRGDREDAEVRRVAGRAVTYLDFVCFMRLRGRCEHAHGEQRHAPEHEHGHPEG
jgi:hypothetical protein